MRAVPPRIMLVDSYPQALYGQQQTLLQLLRASPSRLLEPILLTPGPGALPDCVVEMGLPVVEVPYPDSLAAYGGAIYRYGILRRLRLIRQWMGYVVGLRGVLRRLRVDAVFCNDLRALLTVGVAARTLGVPTLIWDKLDRPHGILDALQLPLASRNLILAGCVAAKYPTWQRRVFASRIRIVRNGIDLKRVAAGRPIRSELGLGEQNVVFAMIGSISDRKGQANVLRAIGQIQATSRKFNLLLVGVATGDADERYLAQAQRLSNGRTMWLGYRDDIPDLLASVDALVVQSDREGGPRVVMEAMAAGKVVISTPVGIVPEVITHRINGFIVPRDDVLCLRQAMTEVIMDEKLRRCVGGAARATALREFDCDMHSRKIIDELIALAEKSSA